ncbi:hypothetical protein GE061_007398 [Apolygus lucorum]|uniref:Cystatin domain-containing protein n=1 Tax=Apolygus lucorum TaxID=248454 RepID=A0A8S9WRL6_APOLU|nr:hypothetical protein GE061_007398 [Apolygus lucorum]
MLLIHLASVGLILGWMGSAESRPFSEDDKKMLKKESPHWKAPPIDEFLEDNVSKKGTIYTYIFKYKNNAESKICDVTLKSKKKADGNIEAQHKWKCKTILPVDPDYQGDDIERRRRHRRRRNNIW